VTGSPQESGHSVTGSRLAGHAVWYPVSEKPGSRDETGLRHSQESWPLRDRMPPESGHSVTGSPQESGHSVTGSRWLQRRRQHHSGDPGLCRSVDLRLTRRPRGRPRSGWPLRDRTRPARRPMSADGDCPLSERRAQKNPGRDGRPGRGW